VNWSSEGAAPWDNAGSARKGPLKGILLGLVGSLLLAGFIGAAWWVRQSQVPLDPATNCPVSGAKGIHAILIDQSDPVTPQQGQRIRQELARLRDKAAGERVDVYVAEGDATNVLRPVFSLCSPGQGKDANALYQNPEQIQKEFEERFASTLTRTIDDLLKAQTRSNSPIAESIRAVAITSFGSEEQGKVPLKLTVISDMIQHSDSYSHFKSSAGFSELAKSPTWRILQSNLKRAEVDVFYLLRPSARRSGGQPIQTRAHQLFWEQAVDASNGRLMSLEVF
jgi:hypothetical protein